MTRRRRIVLVVCGIAALAAGAWYAEKCECDEKRERFERFLLALQYEDPKGPRPLGQAFEANLAESLDRTLDVRQVALDGFWLATDHVTECTNRVMRSYPEAGAAACLRALERGENLTAALEIFEVRFLPSADLPRARRLVSEYGQQGGRVGNYAGWVLRQFDAR